MIQSVPAWWQTYVNGRGFPCRSEILDEVFATDPPSTYDSRFVGLLPDVALPAIDRLVWRRGFFEASYLKFGQRADWDGVPGVLRLLAGRVLRSAKDWGIPLYVGDAFRPEPVFEDCATLTFRHCRYLDMLADDEWQVVSQLVHLHAPGLSLDLLPVPASLGAGVFSFGVRGEPRSFEPVRLTPFELLKALS